VVSPQSGAPLQPLPTPFAGQTPPHSSRAATPQVSASLPSLLKPSYFQASSSAAGSTRLPVRAPPFDCLSEIATGISFGTAFASVSRSLGGEKLFCTRRLCLSQRQDVCLKAADQEDSAQTD